MRKTLLLAILTLSTTATTTFAGGDDLFSKIKLHSTSDSAGKAPQQTATQRRQERTLTGVNALQSVLLAAGYTTRIDENENVTIEMTRGDWTANVVLNLANGGQQLRLAMRLTDPQTNTTIAPETLRGMLEANRTNWGAFFAIAGTPQHIELVKSISNAGLDSDELRRHLDDMADMADKTKDVWNIAGTTTPQTTTKTTPATTSAPATTTTPAATPSTNTTNTVGSLTGKWIATPTTNEAFALQLDQNGGFRLVHVKGTTSTKSKGTFTLASTTLTLKGDDNVTITGTVARTTDGFTLTLGGAGSKSVSLTFKSGT